MHTEGGLLGTVAAKWPDTPKAAITHVGPLDWAGLRCHWRWGTNNEHIHLGSPANSSGPIHMCQQCCRGHQDPGQLASEDVLCYREACALWTVSVEWRGQLCLMPDLSGLTELVRAKGPQENRGPCLPQSCSGS